MPEIQLPTIRLYYEEHGTGDPILLIHGTGSDAGNWFAAPEELAHLGRVISFDRRGCTRSERPQPYHYTTPAEHADDAAALLDGLDAVPAIVIGRSSGGGVALNLALRSPERVRALVLLEGVSAGLSPEADTVMNGLADRIFTAATERGPEAAGETLLRNVLGDAGYEATSADMKTRFAANGSAIVAEMKGFNDEPLDPAQLREITCPALVVAAEASPHWFRRLSETLTATMPNARLALIGGGHMISADDAQVVGFLQEILPQS